MSDNRVSETRPGGWTYGGPVYSRIDPDRSLLPGGAQRRAAGAGLVMHPNLFDQMVSHLAAALPNEGVGLIAVVDEPTLKRAVGFVPGTNVDRSPSRYTMDPAEVLAAIRAIRSNGWRLGAIAHSHVDVAPTPSATDLWEAYYPEALMLIVSFATGAVEARLWQTGSGQPGNGTREVPLLIAGDH